MIVEWSPAIPATVQQALYADALELILREIPAFRAANGCPASRIVVIHDGTRVIGIEAFSFCVGD